MFTAPVWAQSLPLQPNVRFIPDVIYTEQCGTDEPSPIEVNIKAAGGFFEPSVMRMGREAEARITATSPELLLYSNPGFGWLLLPNSGAVRPLVNKGDNMTHLRLRTSPMPADGDYRFLLTLDGTCPTCRGAPGGKDIEWRRTVFYDQTLDVDRDPVPCDKGDPGAFIASEKLSNCVRRSHYAFTPGSERIPGALPDCQAGDPGTGEKKQCWCQSSGHACWNAPHRRGDVTCDYNVTYKCPSPNSPTGIRTVVERTGDLAKYKIYGPTQIAFTIRYRQSCN